MSTMITSELIWHQINPDDLTLELPDADTEVLVYDGILDDTMVGYYDPEPEDDVAPGWYINTDLDPLPKPLWWAEMPYPEHD